jgi:hypothetical protein
MGSSVKITFSVLNSLQTENLVVVDHHVDGVKYFSELRPPTGLLLIPQVIDEYGQP